MSIRTTVTLDEDVLERVKQEGRARGASFRDTLNELLRAGLLVCKTPHNAADSKSNLRTWVIGRN